MEWCLHSPRGIDALKAKMKTSREQMNSVSTVNSKSLASLKRAWRFAKAELAPRFCCRLSIVGLALVLMHARPLHAQAQRMNTNTASVVLHIQVTIVPTVFSPSQTAPQANSLNAVSYSLPSQTGMDVIEQNQTFSGTTLTASTPTPTSFSVLKTTIVVAR